MLSVSEIFILSTPKRKEFRYFASRLESLKDDADLTQAAIADLTGVSQPTVQAWLNGTSGPSIGQLLILADHFKLPTVDELIRPTPKRNASCVVPKHALRKALKSAEETASTIKMILHHPRRSQPKKKN